jgi:uncharacterized protein
MSKMVFINLPVRDLAKSMAFYEAIGAKNNPQFTDHTAACMVFTQTMSAMLLTHEKWATFTKKTIVDAKMHSEVMVAVTYDSRDEVDAVLAKAAQAGANIDCHPPQDYGFMLVRSFEDLDGHIWEAFWMDPNGMPPQ